MSGFGIAAVSDFTGHWGGYLALIFFGLAYILVMGEERLRIRKSMPVLVAAGLMWFLVAIAATQAGRSADIAKDLKHYLLEFGELFLFLLAAITYINTIEERGFFDRVRAWLVSRGLSLRALFWVTGAMAFVMSPIADNLTTALVLGAVSVTLGKGRPKFVALACINIVVAANAGGAFSPFGDITTLMVWQAGQAEFQEFFALVVPSLVSWLIPATIMTFAVPKGMPERSEQDAPIKPGAKTVVALFLLTIAITVAGHNFLHLPPAVGMMFGLGLLKVFSYWMRRTGGLGALRREPSILSVIDEDQKARREFDSFKTMERLEWDTLMFFYGVILCVGALNTLGYLSGLSQTMYQDWGPTAANSAVGVLSAIVDNIPVMFAVLSMNPDMSHAQWLLVTYAAGVGGSMLSIGSAAGVALMGQARKEYTFVSHLKWTWAIAIGYAAGIGVHLWINGR